MARGGRSGGARAAATNRWGGGVCPTSAAATGRRRPSEAVRNWLEPLFHKGGGGTSSPLPPPEKKAAKGLGEAPWLQLGCSGRGSRCPPPQARINRGSRFLGRREGGGTLSFPIWRGRNRETPLPLTWGGSGHISAKWGSRWSVAFHCLGVWLCCQMGKVGGCVCLLSLRGPSLNSLSLSLPCLNGFVLFRQWGSSKSVNGKHRIIRRVEILLGAHIFPALFPAPSLNRWPRPLRKN